MSYCNADLSRYYSNIDQYDQKKTLTDEWEIHSGNVDVYYDCGNVSTLYRDSSDLGDPESSLVGLNADGKWFFDSDNDALYCYNTNAADTYEFQIAPFNWADAKTNAIENGANWLESMLDNRFPRPLPKNDSGSYDYVIDRINGLLACIVLVRSTDPTDPVIVSLMSEVTNETNMGLLDLLNSGKIKLGFEIGRNDYSLEDGTLDADTTGFLTDIQGEPAVSYEKYTVTIMTGGTLTTGELNETVTYKVTDSQGETTVDTTYLSGHYQYIGGGLVGRFVAGIYTAGDTFYLTVRGSMTKTGAVYTTRIKL